MKLVKKKDIFLSFLCGLLSGLFLILIIKNPNVKEFKTLAEIEILSWILPIALSILFVLGIFLAKILFKSIRFLFQFAKFVETGIFNTFIDIGVLNGLIWLTGVTSGILLIPFNIISFSIATVNSYFWNKFWTFEKKSKSKAKEFFNFFIVTLIGMGINTLLLYLGTTYVSPIMGLSGGAWTNIVKIGATFVSMTWNFAGYKFIIFKK